MRPLRSAKLVANLQLGDHFCFEMYQQRSRCINRTLMMLPSVDGHDTAKTPIQCAILAASWQKLDSVRDFFRPPSYFSQTRFALLQVDELQGFSRHNDTVH